MSQNSTTVYQTFWKDSRQPLSQRLVLTLSGIPALALLTGVGAIITLTQPSWWGISRNLLIQFLRPIQLQAPESSLSDLSQVEAVWMLITGRRTRSSQALTYVSPLFGFVSLLTATLFLLLGAIIPYSLTIASGTVLAQGTKDCHRYGLRTYSSTATHLAESFYGQCQVNYSANADTCAYPTNIVPATRQPSLSLQDCPFLNKSSCADDHRALRIEYVGGRSSDYGLNSDENGVALSHRVTCAPLRVRSVTHADGAKVFWFGYPPSEINETETRATVGETRTYSNNDFGDPNRGPFRFGSGGVVYDLDVYSILERFTPGTTFENFHPSLSHEKGDVFVVIFRNLAGVDSTPSYSLSMLLILQRMQLDNDSLFKALAPTTTAVGCVEQFQQCLNQICTQWGSARDTNKEMIRLMRTRPQRSSLEPLYVSTIIMQVASLRYLLQQHHRSPMVIRPYVVPERTLTDPPKGAVLAWTETIGDPDQWKGEVKAWFDLAFLTVKYSFLTSIEGKEDGPLSRYPIESHKYAYEFANTGLICDKVLMIDANYTSINSIGLMGTLVALVLTITLSYLGKLITWTKRIIRIGEGVYTSTRIWLQRQVGKAKWVLRFILGGFWAAVGILTQTSMNLGTWRFRPRRPVQVDHLDDTEMPGMNVPLETFMLNV